ncbi:MAG: LysE family transporter [Candidatus Bathyarchaeia archaeon]
MDTKIGLPGILVALGHGAIEFPLMFLIFFGFEKLFAESPLHRIIGFVGGLTLVYMGLQIFRAQGEANGERGFSGRGHGSFTAGVLTTATNPYFFIWWATIGATLVANSYAFGFIGFLLFTITHWSCDLAWYTLVSYTVFKSRRFWTAKVRKIVFGFCFTVLLSFGVWFIISALPFIEMDGV